MVLDKWETVKHGLFKKDRQDHWEQYVFCLEDSTYLRYYRDLKKVEMLIKTANYHVSYQMFS